MKKTILFLALAVIVFGFSSCRNMAQKFLEVTAEQYNKQCPIVLNEFVRVDKCEAAPNLTLKYSVTMLAMTGMEEIDFQQESIKKAAKNNIIRELQNKPEFNQIKKFGVKYQYSYSDSQGNHLYDVLITPDDYNNPLPENADEEIVSGMIESIRLEIQGMQKQLPMEIGSDISMTAVRFLESAKTSEYTFTLTGTSEETAKADIDTFTDNTRSGLIANMKNNSIILPYLTHGFIFRYIYNDSKGKLLFSVDVTEDDV